MSQKQFLTGILLSLGSFFKSGTGWSHPTARRFNFLSRSSSKKQYAVFETTASALDSAQASMAPPVVLIIARALRTRSGLQTRGRSLMPNPNPILKQGFRKGL